MPSSVESLLQAVLQLPPGDRAAIVEGVITSLDQPDPVLDALWLKEAQDRLAAYRAGELDAVDVGEAFSRLGQPV